MFPEPLILFIISAAISFTGSLQPGPVNMAVIHTALNSGMKSAMRVACGAVLPELIYSSAAMWFSLSIFGNEKFQSTVRLVAIIVFLIIGVVLFFRKDRRGGQIKQESNTRLATFGFITGIVNPMMFPFWLMIITYINATGYFDFDNPVSQLAFIAGTATGALVLLYYAARLAINKREKIFSILPSGINRFMGVIFFILAVWESVRLFFLL
jgi:threonine/homoserine/homoserine lactone efflux protein